MLCAVLYRVPPKKCPTTCVHSLVSVTYQLLQKNQFDVQPQGLVVVHAKDGWYNFINKKVTAISVRHDFLEECMNYSRNWTPI